MSIVEYFQALQTLLARVGREQRANIERAGRLVADALAADGIIHIFGTGHSHLLAEEAFFRAGGLAAVNPIRDSRLMMLEGALESTRAERESGLAKTLLEREDIRTIDVGIIVSNSGRNAVPIEMAMEMRARGLKVIAVTSVSHAQRPPTCHQSAKQLFELADVAIDNGIPPGDALVAIPGATWRMGPGSTVVGAAIVNAVMLHAAEELTQRGVRVAILPSANTDGITEADLARVLEPYRDRIRAFDRPVMDTRS